MGNRYPSRFIAVSEKLSLCLCTPALLWSAEFRIPARCEHLRRTSMKNRFGLKRLSLKWSLYQNQRNGSWWTVVLRDGLANGGSSMSIPDARRPSFLTRVMGFFSQLRMQTTCRKLQSSLIIGLEGKLSDSLNLRPGAYVRGSRRLSHAVLA